MAHLPWLDCNQLWFPHPEEALEDPDGLLALGGDLSAQRLVLAYRNGIFPWFSDDQPILWWSPDPRCVLFPKEIHISKSLRRALNRQALTITANRDFNAVIGRCGSLRPEGTWITEQMKQAYTRLHRLGIGHSFEAWNQAGELVGGLYGLALGRCFFGESMFSTQTNASKILMVHIARQLDHWGYTLMDCQVESDHLLTMGARVIPRQEFLDILKANVQATPEHTSWQMQWQWPAQGPKQE